MQERLKVYEEKMNKSYDALLNEYTSIRAGRGEPACTGQNQSRLLRRTDPVTAGGKYLCTGAAYDSDPAVGEEAH